MEIKVTVPWKAPYGQASWIGDDVLYKGNKVGEVIEEETGCTRTAILTIKLNEGVTFLTNDFDCYIMSYLVLESL